LAEFSPISEGVTRQRRPGGRTAEVTRRINEAVLELLVEGGIDACTFQNVAARAGIERSTLYRRNPDRWPTIMSAIIDFAARETPAAATGTFRGDLLDVLRATTRVLTSPLGPPLMSAAAALRAGAAPGETGRFWKSRREQLRPMFEMAIDRGELPADVDSEELFAMAVGPIYFRLFISARPFGDEWLGKIVDQVCRHYCLAPSNLK
jgi:AcrR family transcriptional regulator